MRRIFYAEIIEKVSQLVVKTSYQIPQEVKEEIKKAFLSESNSLGKKYLEVILKNLDISEREKVPICQDTGLAVFFVKQGSEVIIDTGDYKNLEEVINEGLKIGSKTGYLRNSIVESLDRTNTNNNSPGVVHIIPGEKEEFEISLISKGFGSENVAALEMLNPMLGKEGIEDFIIKTVEKAGSKPCPPIFVGVGIGGSFEKAAVLSKYALCRIGINSEYRSWEVEILQKINNLNIGAGGFGGKTTALDVKVETFPTHIAGLPVAVNISCWAHRFGTIKL